MAIGRRIIQFLRALLHARRPELDAPVPSILSPAQATAFTSLPSFDRAHLIAVYDLLQRNRETDHDLLQAALLHDLGKCRDGHCVRVVHRVARVILRRISPSLLERIASLPAPTWRLGFVLAVHHPELGAEMAAKLGCSARTCWLIAHHEDKPAPDDVQLRRLIAADHAA
jgi:hypothetical protein